MYEFQDEIESIFKENMHRISAFIIREVLEQVIECTFSIMDSYPENYEEIKSKAINKLIGLLKKD